MHVFMINEGTFMDEHVSNSLKALLRDFTKDPSLVELEKTEYFGANVENFMNRFLTQYKSASFGEETFSYFVVLFLQTRIPLPLRKPAWESLRDVASILKFDEEMDTVQKKSFLYPFESDLDLLNLFENLLSEGKVNSENNAFLYWLLVHHCSSFIFEGEEKIVWHRHRKLESIHKRCERQVFVDICSYTHEFHEIPVKQKLGEKDMRKHEWISSLLDRKLSQLVEQKLNI